MESAGGAWWVMFVVSAGATVILGAALVSVVAVVALCVGWVKRRRGLQGFKG
ncbi:hypothetical protein AB0C59_07270 [Streptomyces sp. NPDC048664]|uniref:hypothetical protein n=1 Tax=Streptomyces sp. NPDC048664 TaxID=3154505 RepID=UPI0034203F7B